MTRIFFSVVIAAAFLISSSGWAKLANTGSSGKELRLYKASDTSIQFTGRIDFSNKELPRFWAPGVYIRFAFEGPSCEVLINDEQLWDGNNYISIAIDDLPLKRMKLDGSTNIIKLSEGLNDKKHVVTICKLTESGIGYLEFAGVRCRKLLPPPALPKYKIEFIGNSITCGTGSDITEIACDSGQWYDQHHAYLSYGPLTARALDAQWQLTSVSGIGLTRSCCGATLTMPDVFDKINLRENSLSWDFKKYQPDVVTVCLGQNDGIVDADRFQSSYISFLQRLRKNYPKATLIGLTSPMGDNALIAFQPKMLTKIIEKVNSGGDSNVYHYVFSKQYNSGCGGHPTLEEHRQIADELINFITDKQFITSKKR